MERLGAILSMLDISLNTKRKRHLTGGVLFSFALLFGGLAVTVITYKEDKENNNEQQDY